MPTLEEANQRLLNVARALRESPNPDKFDMVKYGHPCGTPACALGHYAARRDLQDAFGLRALSTSRDLYVTHDGLTTWYDDFDVREHFRLDTYDDDEEEGWSEAEELFGGRGCGGAKTAIEAAEYIEAFVARRTATTQGSSNG